MDMDLLGTMDPYRENKNRWLKISAPVPKNVQGEATFEVTKILLVWQLLLMKVASAKVRAQVSHREMDNMSME